MWYTMPLTFFISALPVFFAGAWLMDTFKLGMPYWFVVIICAAVVGYVGHTCIETLVRDSVPKYDYTDSRFEDLLTFKFGRFAYGGLMLLLALTLGGVLYFFT